MIGGQKRRNAGRGIKCVVVLLAAISGFVDLAPAAWPSGTAPVVRGTPRPSGPHSAGTRAVADKPLIVATSPCSSEPSPSKLPARPLMVVVGASFTAGVGAASPTASWAYLLAGYLGWRDVVRGVPGAGYVRPGKDGMGPDR